MDEVMGCILLALVDGARSPEMYHKHDGPWNFKHKSVMYLKSESGEVFKVEVTKHAQ